MTFSGALTTIATHLGTAGNAQTPKITDIGVGEPGVPPGRCVRYWYEGDGAPARLGATRTLGDQMVGERLTIRAFWPVGTRDKTVSAALEADVQLFARAIKHLLIEDSQLAGNCVDLEVGNADAGWLSLDGGTWRVLSIPLVLDFVDVDHIGA